MIVQEPTPDSGETPRVGGALEIEPFTLPDATIVGAPPMPGDSAGAPPMPGDSAGDASGATSGSGSGAGPQAEAIAAVRRGRPRSDTAHQAILTAARELLVEVGFTRLKLEHVAARAGVGKATIYRRWPSKESLAFELVQDLTSPYIAVPEMGSTRAEMEMLVGSVIRAITTTPAGPVLRALLSQFAGNPALGDPFRATVVRARREETARVIRRGIARGDIRPDADIDIATELLVGPIYFRLMFGGELSPALGPQVVAALLAGYAAAAPR